MNPEDHDNAAQPAPPGPFSALDDDESVARLDETFDAFVGLARSGRPGEGADSLSPVPWTSARPADQAELSCSGAVEDGDRLDGLLGSETRVGDYRIIREVGRGGMGVVYEAEQLSLGRRVALKVLPFAASLDPRYRQRFQLEAQAAAHLHHKHIVPVFAVGRDRGVHFYAMQFINGRSLAAVVRELRHAGTVPDSPDATVGGGVPPTERHPAGSAAEPRRPSGLLTDGPTPRDRAYFRNVARLGEQAALALEHAHALGVIHRDVKPGNLMLDPNGDLWVTDFGLARFLDDPGLTRTGDLLGTLAYMSPEQAMGRREADHRADIYSLGATLYELVVLRPPFEGRDRQELLRKIAHDDPTSPRRLDPSVPKDLETVLLKAMEKEPSARYATAKDLADELRRYLNDQPIRARRPGPVEHLAKWSRRHRPVVLTAATVLLLAMGVGTALMWGEKRRTEDARGALREGFLRTFDVADTITMQAVQRAIAQAQPVGRGPNANRKPAGDPYAENVYRRAVDFYELVARQEPHDPGMRSIIARAYHRLGFTRALTGKTGSDEAFARAAEGYETLIALQPRDTTHRIRLVDTLHEWAEVTARAKGPTEALPMFRRAFTMGRTAALRPEVNPDQLVMLASYSVTFTALLEDAGQPGDARNVWAGLTRFFEELARLPGLTAKRRQELASALTGLGLERLNGRDGGATRRQSERLLRLALVLDPKHAPANNDLARMLADRPAGLPDDPMRAVAHASLAVSAGPSHAPFWNTLGMALFRAGKYELARDALKTSLDLGRGGDPNDWYFLAMIEFKLGDPIKARAWFDRASDWMARNPPADPDLPRFHQEASTLLNLPVLDAIDPNLLGTGAST